MSDLSASNDLALIRTPPTPKRGGARDVQQHLVVRACGCGRGGEGVLGGGIVGVTELPARNDLIPNPTPDIDPTPDPTPTPKPRKMRTSPLSLLSQGSTTSEAPDASGKA